MSFYDKSLKFKGVNGFELRKSEERRKPSLELKIETTSVALDDRGDILALVTSSQ
jgi:hypothetical protein